MLDYTDILACPSCHKSSHKLERIDAGWHCSGCGRDIELINGIIEGQWADVNYREIKDDAFDELLKRSRAHGWKTAAMHCADIPGVNPEYLTKVSRADFQYLLPLTPDAVVLDVGAGLGAIAQVLAPQVHTYVALENDWRRIQFTQLRLSQEHIENVVYLHANVLGHPLQAGIFDIIILNGVLEWLGLQGDEPAGVIQQKALKELHRLLKPGGMLYVGTDNRYALAQLRGAPEPHSMLPYVGVVPRWMADFMVKRDYQRGKGWTRSPMLKKGFRTWTYSLAVYKTLLKSAGFNQVQTWLPHPTYNQPHRIVSAATTTITYFLNAMISHKSSWGRWGRRLGKLALTKQIIPTLYRQVSGFYLFTARKEPEKGTGTQAFLDGLTDYIQTRWVELQLPDSPPETMHYVLLGISGQWPKTALGFADQCDVPSVIIKISRNQDTQYRMLREQENMQAFAALVSLPAAPVFAQVCGRDIAIRVAMQGMELGRALNHKRPCQCEDLIRITGDWLQTILNNCETRTWTRNDISAYLIKMKSMLPELSQDVHDLMQQDIQHVMTHSTLPLIPCHGDFTLANVWIRDDETVCPLDWEEASLAHWPLMDLSILSFDLSIKYRRVAVMPAIRTVFSELFNSFIEQIGISYDTGLILSRMALIELLTRMATRGRDKIVKDRIINGYRNNVLKNKPMDFL